MMNKKKTTDGIIKEFKSIHGDYYDYSKVDYDGVNSKIKIICPEHGEFEQKPKHHLRNSGCKLCGKKNANKKNTLTLEQFIEKSTTKHNNKYDYSLVEYKDAHTKVKIICPIHGEFEQEASSHIRGCGCKICGNESVGEKNSISQDEAIEQFKNIHNDLYDYSQVEYKGCNSKVKIICPIHGTFEMLPGNHLLYGCVECNKIKRSDDIEIKLIDKCKILHNNKYDYSNVQYNNADDKVKIICPIHGEFEQLLHDHYYKNAGCSKCSNIVSRKELEVRQFIKQQYSGEIIHSDKKVLNGLELDIYLPEIKLAIEFDGIYFHSEITGKKNRSYHLNKTKMCEDKGIQLLHIFENEWVFKKDIVRSIINNKVGNTRNKIFARKCSIITIDKDDKNSFLDDNHIQGKCNCNMTYGLMYEDEIVSVMTFNKSRFNKSYKWELSRYCGKLNTSVVGGFSRLLKHFMKNHGSSIISYADKRYSNGNVYEKNGFVKNNITDPTYFYTKNHLDLIRKENFRKTRIMNDEHMTYDKNISEWQNMINNGYDRIWDCGKIVFQLV